MKMRFAAGAASLCFLLTSAAQAGRHLAARPGEEVSDGLLVRLREGAQLRGSKVPARFLSSSRWQALGLPNFHRVQVDPSEHLSVGAALADDPAVDFVEPDRIRRISIATPNDPSYLQQWNLAAIHAKEAWQWFPGRYLTSSLNLERVRIAILDSGADCTHPDFANAGNTSTDTLQGGQLNWFQSNAWRRTTVPSPACAWQDDNGHGTIVAGIVGAATNNATGVASLGSMLELAIYKVTGPDGLTTDAALATNISYAVDGGARVINLSLGQQGYSETLQQAIDYAWVRNVIVIAALGNDGTTSPSYPAGNHHVIGVGAIDSAGALASFSNRGRPVDVVAPGALVLSTTPVIGGRFQPGYDVASGTSFAAPHVAALAGLLAMASPGALTDEIARRIERSADSASGGWASDLGYGRIDAERAITGANWRASSTGSVSGLIRGSTGTGSFAVGVTLNSAGGQTDIDGFFRLSGIAPGDYMMSVEPFASPQLSVNVPVTITAGADTPVAIRLGTAYGTLRGTVTIAGAPAAGTVVAAMQGGSQLAVAVTNFVGQYQLFVPAGTYQIRSGGLFATIATTAEDQIAVAGTIRDVPPLATQGFGRLEGQVRNSRNTAVPGAQVLLSQAGRSYGGVSGASGDYRTIPGPAGTYVVNAEEPTAGASEPATVSLVDNVTGRLDLVLGPGGQTLTLSPVSASYPAVGGTGSLSILSGSSLLNWSAASNAGWLSFTSPATGAGSGTLNYRVTYNPDTASRSARIAINGLFYNVTQSGATDAVVANPSSLDIPARGATGSVALTSSGFWVAASQNPWIVLDPAVTGTGSGAITFSIDSNLTGIARSGQIRVNTTTIPVTQPGVLMILDPVSVVVAAKTVGNSDNVRVIVAPDLFWSARSDNDWITILGTPSRTGTGGVAYLIADNPSPAARTGTITFNNGARFTVTQNGAHSLQLTPASASFSGAGGIGSFTVTGPAPWFTIISSVVWLHTSNPSSRVVEYSVLANPGPGPRTAMMTVSDAVFTVTQAAPIIAPATGLHFVPVQPCRVVDTRESLGALGRPALAPSVARDFPVTSSACGIPASAKSFALNVTVVPNGGLGYLSIYPTGQSQPLVSTLNSVDGRVKANAAIVPAGSNGSITVFATGSTELVLDIFGYFVDTGASADALAFYPIAPCRISDSRNAAGGLGGPILAPGTPRSLPVLSSNCGIPPMARAYSLNVTVVPSGPLGYLTLWPSGRNQPFVSTLNAPTGSVIANAAIVPAGDNGAISAYATNATHLVVDINGYFAAPGGSAAQRFFPVAPCRVLDTRNPNGSLGGPVHSAGEIRVWPLSSGACNLATSATAYSLNATVVPPNGLGYLTMWPAGQVQPFVSTLNASDDPIVANAAIVAAGLSGAVYTFATNQTHLVVDTNGYFAP